MASGNNAEGARIAIIVGAVLGGVGIVLFIIRWGRSRYRRQTSGGSRPGPINKISSAEIRRWYREALHKIVTARLLRESSTASGEPVFLSHYISQGRLRHWVLHVHGHKYELRQQPGKTYYTAMIAPSGFDLQTYQRSITRHYSPEVGNYFYSIIGWTTLSKEQVNHKCAQVSASFGTYALFSNNCHGFLQRLADRIVTAKAPDWDWFRNHAVGGYKYMKQPPLGYNVICASTWSKQLEQTKHYLSTAERQEIDNFIVVLEDLVEENLRRSIQSFSLRSAQLNAASGCDDSSHNNTDGGGGGGDGGGGGGG